MTMAVDRTEGAGRDNDQKNTSITQMAHVSSVVHGPPPPEAGQPLLPDAVARGVSLGTATLRGAVRTARIVGSLPFGAARYTTAASIELGRQAFDAVLGQTGRALYAQYSAGDDDDGGVEKRAATAAAAANQARVASVVATAFDAAHRGFHYLQLATTAGFALTGGGAAALLDASEVLLVLVDGTLGATESSRALRSIVVFLSREFRNPATGRPGERVGVRDLLWGLCGLAYLQTACRRLDAQQDARRQGQRHPASGEAVLLWDVVVLDGQRVDVHEHSLSGTHRGAYHSPWLPPTVGRAVAAAAPAAPSPVAVEDPATALIRRHIASAVPADAHVAVSTSTATIVTVDITASGPPPPITPPPGVELVELSPVRAPAAAPTPSASTTTYRIVFRINTGATTQTTISLPEVVRPQLVEPTDDEDLDTRMEDNISTPSFETPAATRHPKPAAAPEGRGPTPSPRTSSRTTTVTTQQQQSLANQKKVRLPAKPTSPIERLPLHRPQTHFDLDKSDTIHRGPSAQRATPLGKPLPTTDKKTNNGFRSVLKKPGLGNLLHKEAPAPQNKSAGSSRLSQLRKGTGATTPPTLQQQPPSKKSKVSVGGATAVGQPPQNESLVSSTPPNTQMVLTPLTTRALYRHEAPSQPRDSGVNVNGPPYSFDNRSRRRPSIADDVESLASLASLASSVGADNVSIHTTATNQPQSARDELDYPKTHAAGPAAGPCPRGHKSRGSRGSIYTLHTNDSQASLVLSAYGPGRRGVFDSGGGSGSGSGSGSGGALDALDEVRRTGRVPGLFPARPLLHNLQRYMRFSSAAYGRDFLRAMGIGQAYSETTTATSSTAKPPSHHREIAAYARHTGVAPDDILLASFIDAHGGPDAAGHPRVPLVHYISLDHAAGAVVLACRGTLGFEDILADMACDYDTLYWRGRSYLVHKGVHAAARRLLYGADGRVLATLRDALQRHPTYGLVLCGHSLGGAVTALLGVMLAEPKGSGGGGGVSGDGGTSSGWSSPSFHTAALPPRLLLASGDHATTGQAVPCLPAGRPVHVFAYGPPGTVAPSLGKATRGLITSVVHGHDVVPYLSLGVLHDLQAVALAFKTDDSQASAELWARLWVALRARVAQWCGVGAAAAVDGDGDGDGNVDVGVDDAWAYAALKTLRASMLSPKLVPPGEVLVVATQRVLQRTTYGSGSGSGDAGVSHGNGRVSGAAAATGTRLMVSPARRVVLTYVRDVEARFREIRFGLAAFADHSPGRYEKALGQLVAGVQF